MSACVGQVTPAPESCNGLDDDCDGVVDNGLVQTCYDGPAYSIDANGNPKGVCKAGTQVCQNGAWGVCQGEVLPQPEVCSPDPGNVTTALDLNCDGALISCGCTNNTTRPCFSGPGTPGVGICKTGTQTCTGGSWGECTGEVIANLQPEACTTPVMPAPPAPYNPLLDTNCDGKLTQCAACSGNQTESCYGTWGTTDPPPVPAAAGRGQCAWGTRTCKSGSWGPCLGWVNASAVEYCDGKDNDCNGPRVGSPDGLVPAAPALTAVGSPPGTDDNAICPAGSTCLRGVCVPAACGTERPPPEGYVCTSGAVQPGACGTTPTPGCAVGALCQYGTCVDPCPVSPTQIDPDTLLSKSLVCAKGTVCGGGACIAGGCYEAPCPNGQLCQKGACVPDPCASLNCPSGTFCRQGDCVQACTWVTCKVGQKCSIDGFCVPDPCASVTCGAGQRCNGGTCAADPCNGLACAAGQVCDASTGVALCVDDPCVGVTCPAGVCVLGQCFASGNTTGAGTAPAESSSSGGCHCGSGSGVALPALLALLLAPLARRRRSAAPGGRGAALLVVLLSVALAAPGCTKKDKTSFDPLTCAETCDEQRCVDLSSDPAHCGHCNDTCTQGQKCAAGMCGPSDVAPFIAALAPSVGNKDNPALVVTVSGQRFQPDATVRLSTPLGPRTVTCPQAAGGACQWLGAGTLQVTVDLTGIPVGPGTAPFTFRVVNPDHVISNLVTLTIVVPIPSLAGVSPTTVVQGAVAMLHVSGTGFTMGSQCHLTGSGVGEIGLPSALNGGELDCQLDASGVPPGAYLLLVVSETGVRSNSLGVTVTPNDPVVISINPTDGQPSSAIALSVTGDRFDSTSKVVFDTTVIANTLYLDPSHLSVPSFTLPSTAGNYGVSVRNGAGATSNAVSFTVGSNPPRIDSFTPPTAYQGNPAVPLAFTGLNFPQGSVIEIAAPGSTTYVASGSPATTGCSGSPVVLCTGVQGTLNLIQSPGVPQPEGTWNVRIRLGGAGPSTVSYPLRVLSNQAVLRSYAAAPVPAQSGKVGDTKTGFTFQVSNLQGWPDLSTVRVAFIDPANPTTPLKVIQPSAIPPANGPITTGQLVLGVPDLPNLKAGVYAFTVNNPNATPSNALTFSVTPGAPTLTSVCLQGTNCTQQVSLAALGTNPVITLTLTGSNFAPLDQNGNGSTVMVAADFMQNFPAADPCGSTTGGTQLQQVPGTLTVVSPTRIDVSVDTRNAYVSPTGTTYYVEVYNPSGSGAPQKSGCGTLVTSLPWFKLVP
jgi:hypothetical protein